jgi:sirohydrochlorin cobaltochelatase
MSLAIVLFAHGSRDPHWHEPIAAVAQAIAARSPHTVVRCAYLELSTPSLPQAVEALVAQGIDAVRVFPLFLGMGKHAREDLPQLMQGASPGAVRVAASGRPVDRLDRLAG